MRAGDFETGWRINDQVLAQRRGVPDDPRLPYHLRHVWDGRPFDGRDVLVRCYHGLGDTIQFVRYLRPLRTRAASVTLEAQPQLLPLLNRVAGADRVVPFLVDAPMPPSACDLEIMELPHALRLGPDAVRPPYLQAPAEVSAGDLIGVCVRAGGWDPDRSIPLIELLGSLPADAGLVKLQSGDVHGRGWVNPHDKLETILHTAALVAGSKVVISVDTMVAHLAGALGRPTRLLLKHRADWRWMEGRRVSPWYPSMRLFRQERPGDWTSPLAALAGEW